MKRNLARLILILSVIAWAVIVVSLLVTPVNADAIPSEEPQEDDGRIPGDDVPATERCYMTDEEVQEDYENQKISEALYASGYFRDDIPLDEETQAYLRAACEESGVKYELALAVIWKETDFRNIIGDSGDSIGYMQVQPRWHKERMERLDVDDLQDPFGNFRVGCDYIAELMEKYPLENALTAYNSGIPGKSEYAKEVIEYMEELG